MSYHSKTKEEIFKEFNSSEKGLAEKEAEKRLKVYGRNIIKKTHKLRAFKIFIEQFNSFLICILLFAAIISYLIRHYIDGIVITAIIFLNASIGFFQQYKAEKEIINLRSIIVQKSKVIRQGKMIEIPSSELVPGDVVVLNPGDKINADSRIFESENLQVDEAVLTGESLPVEKSSKSLVLNTELYKRENMLFAGTQVVTGSSKSLVVSTGMSTVFGKIAETLQEIKPQKTPMQKRLDRFSKQIGIVSLVFAGIIMLLGFAGEFDKLKMFMVAVSLAVSAIPEGLPAVLIISFAIASSFMSKKNVIVRKLSSVESLGSVSVICSDKTGTITQEKLHVQEIFVNNKLYLKKGKNLYLKGKIVETNTHKELLQLIKTSILCNNARFEIVKDSYELFGDPTEASLLRASLDVGLSKKNLIDSEPSIKKLEFDSSRKMMSIVRDNGRNYVIYSKGAAEKILAVSSFEFLNGQIRKLSEKRKNELLKNSKILESKAFRVLGFAYKNLSKKDKIEEKSLIFLGFIGMIDPPRAEVKEAVKQCKQAGIEVKMITGDSEITAKAIAEQIGINGLAVTGSDLKSMSDLTLKKSIHEIAIFARITPDDKLRITRILQEQGEVVAITGDGVNDVLALKSADIGVAMGIRGTDIARDVSDIVLVDDNFASIVEGIKQGRKTYDNIKKFTKYFLAVNFSEVFLILFALLIMLFSGDGKWFLPLLPLQILWINLVTDSFPALSLVFERDEEVMASRPRKEKSILDGIWEFVVIAGIIAFLAELIVYLISISNNFSPEKTRTLILTTTIIYQLLFVYACRSDKPLTKIRVFSNKWLNYAVAVSIIFHLILVYTPLGNLFGVIPLAFKDWLFVIPFAVSGLFLFEVGKHFSERKKGK